MVPPTARTIAALLLVSAMVAGCGDSTPASRAPAVSADASASNAPEGPDPVVIDTDLDVSDVAAIVALVLDPGLDVRAITITDAGTGVTKCGSARKVIGYLLDELRRSEIPFACGGAAPGPGALPFPTEWRTAADTGWGMDIPPRPETGIPESAVDLLTRTVREASAPITIVALGPWTNLAAAAVADGTFLAGVQRIHAMAGTVDAPGNVFVGDLTADDRLEWNVVRDPSAFASVFASPVPITLVPLDATDDVPVTDSLKAQLGASAAGGANLVYELWVRVPGRIGEGQQLWDELAALTFGEANLASWQDVALSVDASGRLDRSAAGRAVHVAMSADAPGVDAALGNALDQGSQRATPFALQGTVTATFDGSTCDAQASQGISAGIAALDFTNRSGRAAAVSIVGIDASHTWAELEDFVRAFDPDNAEQPAWVAEAGFATDETGSQGPVHSTAIIEAGTYGPVCITGTWPDLEIAIGEPFEVQPQDAAR